MPVPPALARQCEARAVEAAPSQRLYALRGRGRLGPEGFLELTRDLFRQEKLTAESFEAIVVRHLPDAKDAVRLWLHTSAYPPELRIPPGE